MVSWWVPYLPKGCKPDFNNGLEGDSNSDPVLAPQRLFESESNNGPPESNNGPPWATPNLSQIKSTYLFKSPIYDFLVVTITSIVT